jgi:CRP/FNR family transcriptional regulator, cyclic AMP receptor protein
LLAIRIELLQQMPIFGAVQENALRLLLEPLHSVRRPSGAYFFREQDPAHSMFVLESGRVAVVRQWQGREMELRVLGPGDCFGEMALLDLFPRSAAVRALEDCVAIELAPADLLRVFEYDAEQFALIQMNIGREMCRRLRATDEMLFEAVMGDKLPSTDSNFAAI